MKGATTLLRWLSLDHTKNTGQKYFLPRASKCFRDLSLNG